ncbi:3-hydroxybutyryl-CoA dehydrogenase [Advenella faeciporci]|uniref:3-hydroxybutyryl-CoA dehydrogenase n=1 Tax=Advenella faeciporci TaxID=797535 RepID=A0A918JMK3_9BURK|nr:3-hydroxyacyl-CoA dehydrogenase NAD-binding domain-containing protein [Advenella faeciporci]GGW89855.1 3-hydroxybutyryl-CoA dehydrogenase [Advenella faeciporci]
MAYELQSPSETQSVIVGGGTMGTDIATVLLRARSRCIIVEPNPSLHEGIFNRIAQNLQSIGREENHSLLTVVGSLEEIDWSGVHLVIEAIPENLELKQALFKDLERLAGAETILCSNSSSFPISVITEGLQTAERMAGLHFFMPAHIVPLVEVVLGKQTEPAVGTSLVALMKRCGSVPVLIRKDVPGFLANRLQHAIGREAYSLIQSGIVTPEDVDAAVRFGFGFRYLAAGPIMQKEIAGWDVHAAAAATIYPDLSNAAMPPAILTEKIKNGKYGMKTGEGFYKWTPESMQEEKQRYDKALRQGLEILSNDLPDIEP